MDLDNPSYFSTACNNQSIREAKSNPLSISNSLQCPDIIPIDKINLRLFGRSVSMNATESSQFIKGEPRLSDLAPELRTKIKTKNNIVPCSLEYLNIGISEDEVFSDETKVSYYNIPTSNRSYSVGEFARQNRSKSFSSSNSGLGDELSVRTLKNVENSTDAQSAQVVGIQKQKLVECPAGDILIVSLRNSSAASLWVDYFKCYFSQIGKLGGKQTNLDSFSVHHLAVEDLAESYVDPKSVLKRTTPFNLYIIILCPMFLSLISKHPENTNLKNFLMPNKTIALLLGVSDDDITDSHTKVLPMYFKWKRMAVGRDHDENFTKEFIEQSLAILEDLKEQQSSVNSQGKSPFSVSPKKVRQGQSSLFILLAQPLEKDDILKIYVEKSNELIEVKDFKKRNEFTIKISVPDAVTKVSAIINILVEKDGNILGRKPVKCESRLKELEQLLKISNHPVEFMCQSLGFTDIDKQYLDNWLVSNFHKNIPSHYNLLASQGVTFGSESSTHRYEEFPSLLHFAAKFDLQKLALQLLDCPGGDVASEIKNVYGLTPAEIAEQNNHLELAASLRDYTNMNEFSNIYTHLKVLSNRQTNKQISFKQSEFSKPENQANLYNVCPPPRPVILKNAQTSPMTGILSDLTDSAEYLPMHTPETNNITEENEVLFSMSHLTAHNSLELEDHGHNLDSSPSTPKNLEGFEDKVQKELLEIINDFKNNVHSISQAETLVEEWKNRNDVQKSFKEKQEQLKDMRLRYEQIQQDMKLTLKKSSPFDRIKKLFIRRNKCDKKASEQAMAPTTSNLSMQDAQAHRPISSISTSSSGSSCCVSVVSGGTLGGSRRCSVNEARKNTLSICSNASSKKESNRAIVYCHSTTLPSPNLEMVANLQKLPATVEETTSISEVITEKSVTINNQHYIRFPPSGLPVKNPIASQHNQGKK